MTLMTAGSNWVVPGIGLETRAIEQSSPVEQTSRERLKSPDCNE
jgi:hypothetical protein